MGRYDNLITGCGPRQSTDLKKHPDVPNAPARRNKYGAVKVKYDGFTFDSKAEANRYVALKFLAQSGEIGNLVVHPRFLLTQAAQKGWEVVPAIIWTADFAYAEKDGKFIVEDVKGQETLHTKIKHDLFRVKFPEIELRIVRSR